MTVMMPSFFCVGAQKAGTTSLHDWLSQQPDVCLPKLKETNFFSDETQYDKGRDWYLSRFPRCKDGVVMGEIDPEYLFWEDTPHRMKRYVERPKLIFIFRNPLDRALSGYKMSVRRGYDDLSFADALKAEQERLRVKDAVFSLNHHSYMARGRYAEQVERFKRVFPDSEFLYVKFDDLISKDRGLETYERICSFIGISSDPRIADRDKASNAESRPYSAVLNAALYNRRSPLRRGISFLARLLPSDVKLRLGLTIDRINQRPFAASAKSDKVFKVPKDALIAAADEIRKLERLTGWNLKDWMTAMDKKYVAAAG